MPESPNSLLTALEAAKSRFTPSAAAETKTILAQLSRCEIPDPESLLRFHEALLFLRAFPQSASLVPQIERLLNTFHLRVESLHNQDAAFDDFDTSGLAGTTMQDTLPFEAARWLVRHLPRDVEIAWDDFVGDNQDDPRAERAIGSTWPRFIPLLSEDADVEATIPWRGWLDAARGRERDLAWLIRQFEQLPVTDRARAELYDSLRIPLRWRQENLKLSRTRNWTRPRKLYVHTKPLITRSQVSLADELAQPAPLLTKLSLREGESVMQTIREVMLVRYRELYGTTLGDPRSVVRTDLGRGVVMYFWNLPAARRLPLRAYVAGFTLKNGVPINYIEAIGLCEWIEVGFNTFYTYRQGETAWIYAQALRCLHAFTGATTISVYPYQIGQHNDEALDSGAFWFYRKLGFRSGRADLEQLARREEQKIVANPKYRTPRKTLKRLAEAHVFCELPRPGSKVPDANSNTDLGSTVNVVRNMAAIRTVEERPFQGRVRSVTVEERPFQGRVAGTLYDPGFSPRAPHPGPWDTFSTRNLGLRVNHRMAREFGGDSARIRASSVKEVSRALGVKLSGWNSAERHSFENWSLILALIPDLRRWSPQQKRDALSIIRAQAGANEMRYLRLTQQHPRLRAELLRLGS